MDKTKSGKKAYFSKKEWLEIKFKDFMKTCNINKTSSRYLECQKMYFVGAMDAMDEIIPEWREKIILNEPI